MKYFFNIFEEKSLLIEDLDKEIKTTRLCKHQMQCSNHQSNSTKEYYWISAFIPLLDNVLDNLKSRFLS